VQPALYLHVTIKLKFAWEDNVINLSCFGSLSLAKHQIYPCWRKGICPVLLIPEERKIKIDEKKERREDYILWMIAGL